MPLFKWPLTPGRKAAPWPQTDPCGTFSFDRCLLCPSTPSPPSFSSFFAHLVYFGWILIHCCTWGLFHLVPLGTRMLIHFDFCIKDCSLIHISILVQSFYSLLFNVTFYFSNALRSFSRSHCWSSLYLFFFSCRPFHSHFSCFDSLICLKNIYLTFPFCAGWPTPTRTDNTCTH